MVWRSLILRSLLQRVFRVATRHDTGDGLSLIALGKSIPVLWELSMPEQFLDRTYVVTLFQKVCRCLVYQSDLNSREVGFAETKSSISSIPTSGERRHISHFREIGRA